MVDKVNALLPWVHRTRKVNGVHGQRPTPNSLLVVVVVVVHEWIFQHVRFTMVYHTRVLSDTLSSF